jgi:hypothetical protein
MPIKLKPGIVYFLRERDFRTGAFTDYCKIGLVAGERTTEQRVKEHQTGNPRQIHEEVSVETPAVDDLEAYMHGRFAPWRVSGEWFHLTADRLQEAIGEARSRSGLVAEAEPFLAEAHRLKAEASVEPVRLPAVEEQAAHAALLEILRETNRLGAELQLLELQLRVAMGFARGVEGVMEVVLAGGGPTFQRIRFAEEYPALHDGFLVDREPTLKGSFRLAEKPGKRDWPEELTARHLELREAVPVLDPGTLSLDPVPSTDPVLELHHPSAGWSSTPTCWRLVFRPPVVRTRGSRESAPGNGSGRSGTRGSTRQLSGRRTRSSMPTTSWIARPPCG